MGHTVKKGTENCARRFTSLFEVTFAYRKMCNKTSCALKRDASYIRMKIILRAYRLKYY